MDEQQQWPEKVTREARANAQNLRWRAARAREAAELLAMLLDDTPDTPPSELDEATQAQLRVLLGKPTRE